MGHTTLIYSLFQSSIPLPNRKRFLCCYRDSIPSHGSPGPLSPTCDTRGTPFPGTWAPFVFFQFSGKALSSRRTLAHAVSLHASTSLGPPLIFPPINTYLSDCVCFRPCMFVISLTPPVVAACPLSKPSPRLSSGFSLSGHRVPIV